MSYSSQFGTLIVPCPDDEDGTRSVIFSDLDSGDNGRNLSIPLMNITGKVYTLSIVQQRNDKFRFISSRLLSLENYSKQMEQAFKNIYRNDPTTKKAFVDRCVEIIKQNLFKNTDVMLEVSDLV